VLVAEGEFELQDIQTPNGTLVNHRESRHAALQPGDEIGIGKFIILFQPRAEQLSRLERKGAAGRAAFVEPEAARETRFLSLEDIDHVRRDQDEERGAHLKVLARRGQRGRRLPLRKPTIVLGASAEAEITLQGWFLHRGHAQIVSAGRRHRIIHLAGFRPVWVNNKAVRERDLRDGDRVRIGANSFIFFDAVD
jgi:FHA domain